MKEQKKCRNSVLGKLHRPIKLKQCVTVLKDIAVIKLHRAALIYCAEFLAQSLQLHFREITNCRLCLCYLDHGHVLLGWSRLDLAWHLDHSFDQSRHVLVHFVVRPIQIGGGRRAYLLRLQLNHRRRQKAVRERFFEWMCTWERSVGDWWQKPAETVWMKKQNIC